MPSSRSTATLPTPQKLFRKLNSIGNRDVRYWHKADISIALTDFCF
jgi:hypothetical protein